MQFPVYIDNHQNIRVKEEILSKANIMPRKTMCGMTSDNLLVMVVFLIALN